MSNGISVQQVIKQVKEIKGALVGISRTNTALYHSLSRKLIKLEKDLVASCDELTVEEVNITIPPEMLDEIVIKTKELFKDYLEDDSLSKAEILKLLKGEPLEQTSQTEDETSQEEAGTLSGEVNAGAIEESEHSDDNDLLAKLGSK